MSNRNKSDRTEIKDDIEAILQTIGLESQARDRKTMTRLMYALEHPAQIRESPYLSDDDPLKIASIAVLEDFESVTNGMGQVVNTASGIPDDDSIDPLEPWRSLITAIEAYYSGNRGKMMESVKQMDSGTAPARLSEVFNVLSGKPVSKQGPDSFAEKLAQRPASLVEALTVLDEAAAYPEILVKEMSRILPEFASVNIMGASRLCLWGMELIAEERPLSRKDESMGHGLKTGEASRLRALASLPFDSEVALSAWIASLAECLKEGRLSSEETAARLSITGEILEMAMSEEALEEEQISSLLAMLKEVFMEIRRLLPECPPLPEKKEEMADWFSLAGTPPGKKESPKALFTARGKRRKNTGLPDSGDSEGNLSLFEDSL